jgi:hypothetical protein
MVRILTLTEVHERRLTFRSTVDFAVPRGELRAATIKLRNWDGEDVKLEVDKTVPLRQQRERRRPAGDRTWALEFRPGIAGKFRLTLSGSIPVEDAVAGVPMPDVSVPGSGASEVVIAVAGPDLTAELADGLDTIDSPAGMLKDWPGEFEHLRMQGGQVWKVARGEWMLRLRPRGGAGSEPVRVLLADHTAALADGLHWLHEVVFWVRHGPNTDLNILLPKPGTVVALSVDGADVAPLQPERRRLWLPLPGRGGVRAVRVRWRYEDPADSLSRPLLQTPVIEGASEGPGIWTVFVPADFEPGSSRTPTLKPGPGRAALVALYRAESQVRISEALTSQAREAGSGALAAAQERFYANCRQADLALQLTGDDGAGAAPNGDSLAQWQRALLDENRTLAREHGFEEVRAEAERRSEATGAAPRTAPAEAEPAALVGPGPQRMRGSLPDAGRPAYLAATESTATPELTIRPTDNRLWQQAGTAIWLCALAGAVSVALIPRLKARLLPFWPEPLVAVGAFIWLRHGLTLAAVAFILLGASGRLLTLADGVRGYVRARRLSRLAALSGGSRA